MCYLKTHQFLRQVHSNLTPTLKLTYTPPTISLHPFLSPLYKPNPVFPFSPCVCEWEYIFPLHSSFVLVFLISFERKETKERKGRKRIGEKIWSQLESDCRGACVWRVCSLEWLELEELQGGFYNLLYLRQVTPLLCLVYY